MQIFVYEEGWLLYEFVVDFGCYWCCVFVEQFGWVFLLVNESFECDQFDCDDIVYVFV